MNSYFHNLSRIEFVMTMACTGRCKHCSEGDHDRYGVHLNGDRGAELVYDVCKKYKIQSLMTFGGEPLLYPEDVCKIQKAARDMRIPNRHIITNGYFSKDEKRIREVAQGLGECGVNQLMLSVDAFHQETIPIDYVKMFVSEVLKAGVFMVTHPAWLVNSKDNNSYNMRTKEILAEFADMGIVSSRGNIIFPEGNALKYLAEYFDENIKYKNPYEETPDDVRTISISPDGSVLNGNIYDRNILNIIEDYVV